MRNSTLCIAAAALMFAAACLPAQAVNKVRLTFQRSGTDASSVTVSVTDENGNAIDGVTATLESVTTGKGADSTPATAALFNSEDMTSNTNFLGVNMGSNNTLDGYVQFTFKISGLSDFTYNHVDACVASINSAGKFQTAGASVDKLYYKMEAWNTNDAKPTSTLISNSKFDMNPAPNGNVNNAFWLEGKGNTFTTSADEYLVVRFTKIDGTGCYMSLKGIDLYNGYLIRTTPVTNDGLGNVATFSSSSNVQFDDNTTAYIATSLSSDDSGSKQVSLTGLGREYTIPADLGVIVSNPGGNTYWFYTGTDNGDASSNRAKKSTEMPVSFAYVTGFVSIIVSQQLKSTDKLVGSGDNTKELTYGSYYIFNKATTGEAQFSPVKDGDLTLAANKAALYAEGDVQSVIGIKFDDVTSIGTTKLQPAQDGATYDLSGRRVTKLTPGVYVRNGEKFLVK